MAVPVEDMAVLGRSTMALDKMRRYGVRDDVRCSREGYQETSWDAGEQ